MYKKNFFILILIVATIPVSAQRHRILKPTIKTLQVIANQRWTDMPIIELNNGYIDIDFDDLTHEVQRYVYKIEHCTADWQTTNELFESDYIEGFSDGNLIEDIQESLNTNVLYTHYHFRLPNDRCNIILSGNYCVTVYDENNNNTPVLQAYIMVAEPITGVTLHATGNTDKDINNRHQQLAMELNFSNLKVSDWSKEIKTVFVQNGRWDNAVVNPTPQYIRQDGLTWIHNPQLIFDGGNEYRKFELLDVNHANMGVESQNWDKTEYHAYLWTDEPRINYTYDEDANGAFFIRNSDNREIEYTSEYQTVHFRLKAPRGTTPIYLNGNWTYGHLSPEYQLSWNEETKCYETKCILKQGYYNYQYLSKSPSGRGMFIPSEGNFFQTENRYTALIYYHSLGSRYDRLVGTASLHTYFR